MRDLAGFLRLTAAQFRASGLENRVASFVAQRGQDLLTLDTDNREMTEFLRRLGSRQIFSASPRALTTVGVR